MLIFKLVIFFKKSGIKFLARALVWTLLFMKEKKKLFGEILDYVIEIVVVCFQENLYVDRIEIEIMLKLLVYQFFHDIRRKKIFYY